MPVLNFNVSIMMNERLETIPLILVNTNLMAVGNTDLVIMAWLAMIPPNGAVIMNEPVETSCALIRVCCAVGVATFFVHEGGSVIAAFSLGSLPKAQN